MRVILQGITGRTGQYQTGEMLKFGTNIVAGVTPGKGGQKVHGVPVYNSVKQTLKHKPTWSVLFVPAQFAKAAAMEALKNKLNIVIVSEHVPTHDAIEIIEYARKAKRQVYGPNCPGFAITGKYKLGIMPNQIFSEGNVGVISRSGTLTYEIIHQLTQNKLGQSQCIGIGGDPCIGTDFITALKQLSKDKKTKAIVLIGEIGGSMEEQAADYIRKHIKKPVIAYIAGMSAPEGKKMGHAGAITDKGTGTTKSKLKAFKNNKIPVAKTPSQIINFIKAKF